MMKRLFILRDEKGNPFIGIPRENGPLVFETKAEAKDRRDEVNASDLGYTLHVSPGPDHKGKHSRRGRTHTRARRTHQE